MNADPTRHGPPGGQWWLDPGLARLAFGSSPGGRPATGESTMHLAFLPVDALELDLADPAQRDFGDYELREQIGQGGMGVVYRAWQKSLEREVAVKLLSAGPWASEEFIAGFRREARNAASLQHPNIVAVHEMGEQDGLVFYAMQLVRGDSLAAVVEKRGRLPPREAATLLRTVAEAVDYAHRLGVLHLDLKPGNILIDAEGTALVTDFGLARRLGQAPSLENEQISGTPSYMAPEQAQVRSARLSAATDIWGMGAVLYECLTGFPPFTGPSPEQTLERVLTGTVRRPSRHADVPRDLEAICLRCLSRPQPERYATARELADDLGRFLEHRAVAARPLNPLQRAGRWVRREPALAAASGLAVAALVAGLVATTQQWRRAEHHAITASQRLWEGRREAALQLEAAGDGWNAVDRLLRNIAEQDAAGLDDQVAADRRRLGVLLGQGATLVDATVIGDAPPLAVAVEPDGMRFALAFGDRTVRWYDAASMAELGRIELGERRSSGGELRATTWLRFAGGDRLLATQEWYRTQPSPTGGDTVLIDMARAAVVDPPAAFAGFSDAAYSDDGRVALLRDVEGRVQAWDVATWTPLSPLREAPEPGGPPLPWLVSPDGRWAAVLVDGQRTVRIHALPTLEVVHTLSTEQGARWSAWAIDPLGARLGLGDDEGRLRVLDLPGGTPRMLPSARGREVSWVAFDAGGTWLVGGAADGRLHAFDAVTGDPLVSGAMDHDFPIRHVSVDRAHRLLVVVGEGRSALWRLPVASGDPSVLAPIRIGVAPAAHAEAGAHAVDWSPRTGLLASAGHDGQVRLWRLPAGPAPPVSLSRQLPETPSFAAGRLVDVEWNRLRVVDFDGRALTDWRALAQPPGFAEITPDGAQVLATVGATLQRLDARTLQALGPSIPLPGTPQRFALAPDGRRLLLAFAAPHDLGFGERVLAWDVATGRAEPGELVLRGPLLQLVFSGDGTRVVAIGPADDATTVFAADGLRVLGMFEHDVDVPVIGADFVPGDDTRVWLLTRAPDATAGDDRLLRWKPASGVLDLELALAPTRPFALAARADGGVFVAGDTDYLVLDGAGGERRWPRAVDPGDSILGYLAASPDRTLFAIASRVAARLYAADGTPVGTTLRIGRHQSDGIFDVLFAPDGSTLQVRTVQGFAHWPTAAPAIDDDGLSRQLAWFGIGADVVPALHIPGGRDRAALRDADPGAWPAEEPRPVPPAVAHGRADGSAIPPRSPDAPASALDLTPVYAVGPDSIRNSAGVLKPFLRPWPAGVQRIGGVELDVRGIADVGPQGLAACLTVPGGVVEAVHPLLIAGVATPEDGPRVLATLELHYADGGRADVPLRATVELPGYGENDQDVPFAFTARAPRAAMGFRIPAAAVPRLANPEPARPVRCVDLRSAGGPVQLFGVAVTPAGPPVIAGGVSRITE